MKHTAEIRALRLEAQGYIRDTAASQRGAMRALEQSDWHTAQDMATQAAGCAGEVENIVAQLIQLGTDTRKDTR